MPIWNTIPTEIPAVIAPILQGQADVVYGSRFMVRRAARVLYFYHYLANRFLTFLSNLLTNRNMTRHRNVLQGVSGGTHQAVAADQQRVRHGSGDHGDGLQDQGENV